MARLERKDLLFWAIPIAIGCAAAFYAWRAYHAPAWGPSTDQPELVKVDPCSRGRYRCRDQHVEMTTGDHMPDGGPMSCAWVDVATCARECVTERATLFGVDNAIATKQLCDPPKQPLLLLSKQESFLDQNIADAGICEGDGYVPTDDGFIQCISRSSKDRASAGIVIGRAICRAGAIRTTDGAPRLIKREEAAALWCKRDPIADVEPDAGSDAGDAASDVSTDATDADTK